MSDFTLPDLGEGLTEAQLVAWRVAVGDEVTVDQIVAEVETAKAVVEVPVPFAGTVSALHAEPGALVAVGRPLISVEPARPREPSGFAEPGVVTADDSSGNVLIGYGTRAPVRRRSRRAVRHRPVPDATEPGTRPAVISPLVRKLALDAGLDLHALRGTGSAGVVTRRDVEAALSQGQPTLLERTTRPEQPGVRRIPLRHAAVEQFARSRREIPEATVWVDVDATELLAARATLNAAAPDRPVSVLALLTRFVVLGLSRFPELNGRVEGNELVVPEAVHVGLAAQTPRGLMVPVVRDAHRLSTRELSGRMSELIGRARDGALAAHEVSGGTVTVNNYGVYGVDGSAAIINHPEVAIVGIGRIIDRPWVVDGALAVRKVAELTLAFDHRACDGAVAGNFLRFVADCVESPITALGEL